MLTRLLMAIIWQHVHKLKHYVVHLKLIYCYMSYMSIISHFFKNQHIEKGLETLTRKSGGLCATWYLLKKAIKYLGS